MDQLPPFVFHAGVVGPAADDGQQVFGQPHSRDRAADNAHYIDDDQFLAAQREPRVQQAEEGVDEEGEEEKQEDRAGGAEVQRHVRAPQDHIAVGGADADAAGDGSAAEQGAGGDAGGGCTFHIGGVFRGRIAQRK
ncbi:MAG: hypothetical protein CME20_19995 [Gemmatimonadetes bacterium]|nr:hypothetical protein [Gemmatimonadota bacterium]